MSLSHAPCWSSFWPFVLVFLSLSSISFSFHPASSATTTLQNRTDQQALLSFKSLLSDPLGTLASWKNESLHFCNWRGITCGGRRHQLRVTALDLDSQGLAGSISASIANLTFLRRINLSNNQLHGQIPQELSLLPRLQYLDLSKNLLEGDIPSNLSHCPNLKSLSLGNNMLEGEIPREFGSHRKLQILNANDNNLIGGIPPLLGRSPSLTRVHLGENSLGGGIPHFLANSSSLVVVNLSGNTLTGEIPHSLFNSSSLQTIDLFENGLTGSIPSFSMIRASPFVSIDFSGNELSGSIPPSLGNLSSLLFLYLDYNFLEGSIPECLGKIMGLKGLDLSSNNLFGRMPPPLYNLSSLIYLGVGANRRLFGTLPPDIGITLPNLQSLVMQGSLFQGHIPASLYNASNIQMLDLAMNSFEGLLSSSVGSLKNLVDLNLGENQLQGNVWSVLSSLTNCSLLKSLYLQDNKLEGTLPSSVGNLSIRLETLAIGGTQISGTIPVDIGNLVNLNVLYLTNSLFTGNIPPTIGKLRNLNLLYMRRNKLSGPIPSSIGNLTRLSELYMEDNELSGNIPASFGDCRNLNILNLSNNAFTGAIPKELVGLSSLTRALDLSHNYLTGSIPMEVGSLINLDCLNISNNRLSGEIPSTLGYCQHLEYLHLEGNFFQGNISRSFSNLRGLDELDVSRNNLSGRIPEFFGSFSFLRYLNLSFNDLEGEVPTDGVFGNSSETFVLGNKRLCGGDPRLQLPPCSVQAAKRNPFKIIIIAASVAAILFLGFLVILLQLRKGRGKSPSMSSMEGGFRIISYTDIFKATDGFSPANLLGTGSFGSVYKAKLDGEEKFVAVKVFRIQRVGALRSFKTECEIIRNIRHNNLVKVITSCSSMDSTGNDFKALIFEYMPNGSLEEWLQPGAQECHRARKLNLTQRLNIALDVASALCYLHHDISVPVTHGDLKPSNILLDNEMTAHVGDFGLARFLPTSGSMASKNSTSLMGIEGTIGYVAPEYAMGSQISTQGDVYSYGILLLEMLTGKKPTNSMFKDGLNLHNFVNMAFPERVMTILDPQILQNNQSEEFDSNIRNKNFGRMQLRRIIISLTRIGLLCSKESPKERPRMQDVTNEVRAVKEMFSKVEIIEEGANLPE